MTGGKERIRYYANDFLQDFAWPEDRDQWVAGLHQLKTRLYLEMLQRGKIPLRSGVAELISQARAAGLLIAIATTTTPANVTHLLNATLGRASPDWFAVIAAGDIVPNKKPAPDIYFYALQRLGLSPAQCIAFEDSHNGLLAAKGAGLKTIISTNAYTAGEDFTGAGLVVDKWGTVNDRFTVISGDAGAATCLDLDLVRRIHGN